MKLKTILASAIFLNLLSFELKAQIDEKCLTYELINQIICELPVNSFHPEFNFWNENFDQINPINSENLLRDRSPVDLREIFDEKSKKMINDQLSSESPKRLKKGLLACQEVLCKPKDCSENMGFGRSISRPIIAKGKEGCWYALIEESFGGFETGGTYFKLYKKSGSEWILVYEEMVAIS